MVIGKMDNGMEKVYLKYQISLNLLARGRMANQMVKFSSSLIKKTKSIYILKMEYAQHYDDKLKHNLKLLKMYFNLAIKNQIVIFPFALILFTLYYISIIH